MSTTHYEISSSGALEKVLTERTELRLNDSIAAAMCGNLTTITHRLLDFGHSDLDDLAGHASARADSQQNVWFSVRLKQLPLNAPNTMFEGMLVPDFSGTSPVLPMIWRPPEDMALVLGLTVIPDGSERRAGNHYLIAYDAAKQAYRLPVANLYADCRLCHGQGSQWHGSAWSVLGAVLLAFRSSVWNGDLYTEPLRQTNTRKLIRFKPENNGLTQLPSEGNWTALCERVVAPVLDKFIIPL